MAILDPRLLPLIDVLAQVGMDWLAFELVEGVRRGEEPVEDGSALRRARDRAKRTSDASEQTERFAAPTAAATPFQGDDQLEWAVRYVEERLFAALDQMAESLDALDEIVSGADAPSTVTRTATTRLLLRGHDRVDAIGRLEVDRARTQLPALRVALDSWLGNERSDSPQ